MEGENDVATNSEEQDSMAEGETIFDILGVTWKEHFHSRILAWLLDPKKSHGIGNAFLRGFINTCKNNKKEGQVFMFSGNEELSSEGIAVQTEYQLPEGRRPDIVVSSQNEKWVCVIENKIGAPETNKQTLDYLENVESKFEDFQKGFVYLSPHGGQPASKKFVPITYLDVLNALKQIDVESLEGTGKIIVKEYRKCIEGNLVMKKVEYSLLKGVPSLWALLAQIKLVFSDAKYHQQSRSLTAKYGGHGASLREGLTDLKFWLGVYWDHPEELSFSVVNLPNARDLSYPILDEFKKNHYGNPHRTMRFEDMGFSAQDVTVEQQVEMLRQFVDESIALVDKNRKDFGIEKQQPDVS